jgi:hypothetical protein
MNYEGERSDRSDCPTRSAQGSRRDATRAYLRSGGDAGDRGSTAPGGTTSATSSRAANPTQLMDEWAACMRTHGVPNYPDPGSDGKTDFNGTGVDPNSPWVRNANKQCGKLNPDSGPPPSNG